jgi:hypothetical protein
MEECLPRMERKDREEGNVNGSHCDHELKPVKRQAGRTDVPSLGDNRPHCGPGTPLMIPCIESGCH